MWKISSSKLSMFLLMAAQTAGFIVVVMKLHYKTSPVESKPERSQLLIISTWRSGSSFTGQLFSQHPDVFYMMEPAWHVWGAMGTDNVKVLHMSVRDLFRSIFHCDMSVYDAYMPPKREKSELFQWETSRALCSPPACYSFKRGEIISQLNCKTLCANYPFESIQKACKSYNYVVIKEVRIFDLKVLYPLLEDPSLNLKILHLVRDPRAVFHSRTKVDSLLSHDNNIMLNGDSSDTNDSSYKAMEKVCNSHAQIYKTALFGMPEKLYKRYMMVRYEDIVRNPLEKAMEMYKFANLPFTPQLQEWVHNMTHGNGNGPNFIISSRDALNTSRAWRTELSFESVEKIQGLCSRPMALFGYKSLQKENQQKDLSIDTLLPILIERKK